MIEAEVTEKTGFKFNNIEWIHHFSTLYLHGQNEKSNN